MPEPFPPQEPTGTIPPPDRTSEPTLPPPLTEPSADRRISAQDAEQAEAKKVQSWVEAMDALETSVVNQGRFFAKFGEKSDDPQIDSRALVLIEPITEPGTPPTKKSLFQKPQPGTPEKKSWVVITRDGPKIMNLWNDQHPPLSGYEEYFIISIRKHAQNPDPLDPEFDLRNGYAIEAGGHEMIYLESLGRGGDGLRLSNADPGIVNDTIRRSIDSSESPLKARVEAADKSAEAAKAATAMVTGLPPRN